MRIQFNAEKHRQDIENGKLKVITRGGLPVKIFDWDLGLDEYPIVAQIKTQDENYKWSDYRDDGKSRDGADLDLFVIENIDRP